MNAINESKAQMKEQKRQIKDTQKNFHSIQITKIDDLEMEKTDKNKRMLSHQSIQCDQQDINNLQPFHENSIKGKVRQQKVQTNLPSTFTESLNQKQPSQISQNNKQQKSFQRSNNKHNEKQQFYHNLSLLDHQLQMNPQQQHLYEQSLNNRSSLKQILKFHKVTKPKVKKTIFQQLTTQTNFNKNKQSIDINKVKASDRYNSQLSNSQGSRWRRSQSYIQQKQLKRSLQQSLIKSYHKHESKHFANLQKYMKIFIEFQDKLMNQPFAISLLDNFQIIKQKMELYLQNIVNLQHIPFEKPTSQWTQQKLTNFFTQYKTVFLNQQSINSLTQKLTLKKYKNCVYFGHMINGKKQGQGVIYYFNGKLFQGNFKNDQKIFGFQIQSDGYVIYIGDFEKGIRHGTGMLKVNEYLLWGRFTKGQFQKSIEQNPNSRVKEETLSKKQFGTRSHFNKKVNNHQQSQQKQNKQGFKLTFNSIIIYSSDSMIVKTPSNDIYIGNYNQETQQKHGEGLQIFMNGDLYIGNYENNTPQQYGEYYWASGAFYRGQFVSGMRHGKGKWQMLHGDSFQGEYMNDKKNGQGTYLWKNGSKYTGVFENDYRHGYGEMQWNDGRSYKGEWINGIQTNVTIQLDNGLNNKVTKNKNAFNTISVIIPGQKKPTLSKRYNLPSVQKKQIRSVSNPSTRNSFQTVDSSLTVKKKITLQNIKALYNPSNH